MRQNILLLYKPVSITPLELIEKFRLDNPLYKDSKLGYAGRLDPMAEGLLLILVGDENKKKKAYEKLKKTYEFSVLFGVKTDTYDILGLAQKNFYHGWEEKDGDKLKKYLKELKKTRLQKYPPFSSRTVNGVPLYKLARENKLSQVEIPTHKIRIYTIKLTKTSHISSKSLMENIEQRVGSVQGDFRQEKILATWREVLGQPMIFTIKHFEINVTSGTYIREIANQMGEYIGKQSLALSIKRTRLGQFSITDIFGNKKPV